MQQLQVLVFSILLYAFETWMSKEIRRYKDFCQTEMLQMIAVSQLCLFYD